MAIRLRGLFILSLRSVHITQTEMRPVVSRVALNPLLNRLGRFVLFSGYILIVAGGDCQLFPLACVFP